MNARTTPFTRMRGLRVAYEADQAMLASLDRGDVAAERMLARLLRSLGHEPDAKLQQPGLVLEQG